MQEYKLNLLGFDIVFKAGVNAERVQNAKLLVEERYEKMSAQGGKSSKELLLTFLVLGLADDLLQANAHIDETNARLDALLHKIEELI